MQTDKKYQLADWRVRPLPEELVLYARMDTHYLLYIFDCLKVCHLGFVLFLRPCISGASSQAHKQVATYAGMQGCTVCFRWANCHG